MHSREEQSIIFSRLHEQAKVSSTMHEIGNTASSQAVCAYLIQKDAHT